MTNVRIDVRGLPRPQGSMRTHALPNGHVAVRYPPAVWEWRRQVQQAAAEAMLGQSPLLGAVELRLGFDLPRPTDHFLPANSRRLEPELRPSAPAYPAVMPDLDKLVRCIGDALTDAGVWKDDGQVVFCQSGKRYTVATPGVFITIKELT